MTINPIREQQTRCNNPSATNREQQTQIQPATYDKSNIRRTLRRPRMPREPVTRMSKSTFQGNRSPAAFRLLYIRRAATKMKYDVRIGKAEESRYLSVFFKADVCNCLVPARRSRNPRHGPAAPNFEAAHPTSRPDYLDFPAPW